ncbi:MAG: chorismate mutase [Candidatus Levybacteria bacterium]|nr:chorismate mutase [Candidatus Levybacteria bacterium]
MKTLDTLRSEIDDADRSLMDLLAKRLAIAREIGKVKKQEHADTVDAKREEEMLKNLVNRGKSHDLSETFVHSLWKLIVQESYKMQE